MLRQIQKNTDEIGFKLVEVWASHINQLDDALSSGDMRAVAQIYTNDMIPIVYKLLPHVTNDELQEVLSERVQILVDLVKKLQSGEASLSDLNRFHTQTYDPLTNLLNKLLKVVGNVVGGVGDIVGDVSNVVDDLLGGLLG